MLTYIKGKLNLYRNLLALKTIKRLNVLLHGTYVLHSNMNPALKMHLSPKQFQRGVTLIATCQEYVKGEPSFSALNFPTDVLIIR